LQRKRDDKAEEKMKEKEAKMKTFEHILYNEKKIASRATVM
jgi:hypothetical protein